MGQVNSRKIVILLFCFILTSIVIYRTPTSTAVQKQVALSQVLADINGWAISGFTPLDPRIVKALKLDDYANQNYSNGDVTISLYIGYYLNMKKIGAAHDPMVCFPGQGWVVSNIRKGKFTLSPGAGEFISYSTMTVQQGLKKELIIYWFQSYDRTNPDTFSQKIRSLYQKIFYHMEGNAFVRISTPMRKKSLSECREAIFEFIRSFYPIFLKYVKS